LPDLDVADFNYERVQRRDESALYANWLLNQLAIMTQKIATFKPLAMSAIFTSAIIDDIISMVKDTSKPDIRKKSIMAAVAHHSATEFIESVESVNEIEIDMERGGDDEGGFDMEATENMDFKSQ